MSIRMVPAGRPQYESQITSRWESAGKVNWFNQGGYSNGGGTGLSSSTNGSDGKTAPPSGHYSAERNYLDTSGETGGSTKDNGFRMQFNTSVGNHYWLAASIGLGRTTSPNDGSNYRNMSPLWTPNMNGVAFKWHIVDNGSNSNSKHRIRVYKMGMTISTYSSGRLIYDMTKVAGSDDWKNYKEGSRGGYSVMELPSSVPKGIVCGMYFQLETEGGGAGTASGSRFVVYQLTPTFKNPGGSAANVILPQPESSSAYIKQNSYSMYGQYRLNW